MITHLSGIEMFVLTLAGSATDLGDWLCKMMGICA